MPSSLESDIIDITEPLLWEDYSESSKKSEKHAELIQKINIKNAKYLACGLIFGFILYHGTIHLRYGNYIF